MAAAKRKLCEVESEAESEKKKKTLLPEDRLSNLPVALQLRILACLDAKQSVQTTLLSKTWANLWTQIPDLNFHCLSFGDPLIFDHFVDWVLRRRDPGGLTRLKFIGHESLNDHETLKKAFDYAFSHGVKQLEAYMELTRFNVVILDPSWPVSESDSLTSLKLQAFGRCFFRCPFLRSLTFNNLADLYLNGAAISETEPIAGFPVLESLTLLHCVFRTENSNTVRLQSRRLSDLTISHCRGVKNWELRTPRLKFLEYRDANRFPNVHEEGLPVLETLKIDFYGLSAYEYSMGKEEERQLNDDLLSLFSTLCNVKSVTLFSATVLLVSLYPDELVKRGSPFRELKELTMDLSYYCAPRLWHKPGKYESVKAYLLHNSPQANFTIIRPTDIDVWRDESDDPWDHFWN